MSRIKGRRKHFSASKSGARLLEIESVPIWEDFPMVRFDFFGRWIIIRNRLVEGISKRRNLIREGACKCVLLLEAAFFGGTFKYERVCVK